MENENSSIKIRSRSDAGVFLMIGGFILLGIGAVLDKEGIDGGNSGMLFLLGGLALPAGLIGLLFPQVFIELTADGIKQENEHVFIPWSEIISVRKENYRMYDYLIIKLKDPGIIKHKKSHDTILKLSSGVMGGRPMPEVANDEWAIFATFWKIPVDDVIKEIERKI